MILPSEPWTSHAYRQWLMLLDAQCGIVDRAQAKQAGFSDRQIWHRLRSGRWQRVHEGVYATFTGPLTRDARLWAALRRAGEGRCSVTRRRPRCTA